ncbi:MAG: energy transducer TonB, partial [Acidobacteriota bacterium]
RLGDLRVLASGFLDLSTAAAAPPPEPVKPPASAVAERPAAPTLDPHRIWTGDDPGVTAPTMVKQDVPRVPSSITSQMRDRGMLELVIDEQGRVVSIVLRSSVHPVYDPLLMGSARQWRYNPATVGGVPVKFRKLVQITVSR